MPPFSPPAPFFPPPLPKQGTVGLVAPSRWPKEGLVELLQTKLEARGLKLIVHEQVAMHEGRLAGPDAARAAAIRAMVCDARIDAIFCARGGTGALRLLDLLDYEVLRAHPKPFVGYSDVTALLHAITAQTGMVTFHGPMASSFVPPYDDPRTEDDLFAVLMDPTQTRGFGGLRVARAGAAQGRLFGGCLTLLHSLLGTPYDWPAEGSILFIEDTAEPLYNIDRMMTHLRLAGKLNGVSAVLVGEMIGLTDDEEPEDTPFGKSIEQIVAEHVPPDVPLAFGLPCGHGRYLTTLPIGAQVSLTLEGDRAAFRVHAWN